MCPFRRCFRRGGFFLFLISGRCRSSPRRGGFSFSSSWAAAVPASGGAGFLSSSSYFWTAAVPAPAGRRTLGFPAASPRSPWFTPCVVAYSCVFPVGAVRWGGCLRIRGWTLWDSPDSFPFWFRGHPLRRVGPGLQPGVDLFGQPSDGSLPDLDWPGKFTAPDHFVDGRAAQAYLFQYLGQADDAFLVILDAHSWPVSSLSAGLWYSSRSMPSSRHHW